MLIVDKAKLLSLYNSKKGQRGYILANGPSLLNEDLHKLNNKSNIITLNASSALEDKYKFHSEYYCLTDPRFLEIEEKRNIAFHKLKDMNSTCLCRDILKDNLSFEGFNPIYLNSIGRDGFSRNLLNGFYFGATTTMLAVQLAYWIGLREVFILGLDLDYLSSSYSRFYHEENTQVTDLLVSVQIRNLSLASRVFTEENRSIYLTNMKSWASSYMRCKDLE